MSRGSVFRLEGKAIVPLGKVFSSAKRKGSYRMALASLSCKAATSLFAIMASDLDGTAATVVSILRKESKP